MATHPAVGGTLEPVALTWALQGEAWPQPQRLQGPGTGRRVGTSDPNSALPHLSKWGVTCTPRLTPSSNACCIRQTSPRLSRGCCSLEMWETGREAGDKPPQGSHGAGGAEVKAGCTPWGPRDDSVPGGQSCLWCHTPYTESLNVIGFYLFHVKLSYFIHTAPWKSNLWVLMDR